MEKIHGWIGKWDFRHLDKDGKVNWKAHCSKIVKLFAFDKGQERTSSTHENAFRIYISWHREPAFNGDDGFHLYRAGFRR